MLAYHNQHTVSEDESLVSVTELLETPEGEISIFANLAMSEAMQSLISNRDLTRFSRPLLDQLRTREQIQFVERLSGKLEATATNIAAEIVKDIRSATQYPPGITEPPNVADVSSSISQLIDAFNTARQEANKTGE